MIIFRKNALNKISSSEELDKSISIINPLTFIIIILLLIISIIFIFWSFTANISTYARAPGIFLPKDGIILSANSKQGGTLDKMLVNIGDIVEQDELVAEFVSEDIKRKLLYASEELALEQALYDNTYNNISESKKQRAEIREKQLLRIDENIEFLKTEVALNKQILDRKLKEYENRDISQAALSIVKNNYLQSRQQLHAMLSDKEEKIYQESQINYQNQIELDRIKQRLSSLENSKNELQKSLSVTQMTSPMAGRVIEIKAVEGANIATNESVLYIVSSQSEYYAEAEKFIEFVAYVDAQNGRKIYPGMSVNIEVNSFSKNSYGFIKGTVKEISSFPITSSGILTKLSNRSLVDAFTRNGPVYQVVVNLLHDSASKNRLLWSTNKGSEIKSVDIGNLGSAEFILSQEKPITKVIPALKQILN